MLSFEDSIELRANKIYFFFYIACYSFAQMLSVIRSFGDSNIGCIWYFWNWNRSFGLAGSFSKDYLISDRLVRWSCLFPLFVLGIFISSEWSSEISREETLVECTLLLVYVGVKNETNIHRFSRVLDKMDCSWLVVQILVIRMASITRIWFVR